MSDSIITDPTTVILTETARAHALTVTFRAGAALNDLRPTLDRLVAEGRLVITNTVTETVTHVTYRLADPDATDDGGA